MALTSAVAAAAAAGAAAGRGRLVAACGAAARPWLLGCCCGAAHAWRCSTCGGGGRLIQLCRNLLINLGLYVQAVVEPRCAADEGEGRAGWTGWHRQKVLLAAGKAARTVHDACSESKAVQVL